jgi:RimJ/RimL family protein N-acetyltransferase
MQLTTERLILREFVETDWQAVLAYQSNPRYLQYYPWDSVSAESVRMFVNTFITWQHEHPRTKYQLAIVSRADGQLLGTCGLRLETFNAHEGELGYELAPACWGQGYATEAAYAMLAFGFEEVQLHRIRAFCIAENHASTRVLEKLGLQCEGRIREKYWMKYHWWDVLLYGMLESEWRSQANPDRYIITEP